MTVNISYFAGAGWQFFDNDGRPLNGGLIYTYLAGTTTPATTYTSNTGLISNSNPIVLDASGRVPNEIWVTTGQLYKFVLKTSAGVLLGTYDNITSVSDVSSELANTTDPAMGDALVGFRQSNASGNLTNAVGRTVHQKFQSYIDVKDFGAVGNGVANDTTAINNALAAVSANGGGSLYFPKGTYMIATIIQVPDNITIFGDGAKTIIKCSTAIPRGVPNAAAQGQCISLGNNCSAYNFVVDGGGYGNGGILGTGVTNIRVENVDFKNGGTVSPAQAFHFDASTFIYVSNCSCLQAQHGIQVWKCGYVTITGCNINTVAGGGIWTASASDMTVSNNVVQNCGDVGLDFEGGYDCSFVGNTVSRCYNAELSMFKDGAGTNGCVNLSWIGNTVHRTEDYLNLSGASVAVNTGADSGAIWIASVSDDARSVLFAENNVLVNFDAGSCWYVSGDWNQYDNDVTFRDNTFTTMSTSPMFTVINRCRGMKYVNNTHHLHATQSSTSVFKNPRGALFSGNVFWTNASQTQYAVTLYTDELINAFPCLFEGNVFKGFGQYALSCDSYNNVHSAFIVANNTLTEKPEVNGGINVVYGNGLPKYKDQQLLVAITDSTNPTVAVDLATGINATRGTTYAPIVDGMLAIALGGVQRNLYKFIYTNGAVASLNGSGVSTGATASATDYATFAGSTITITKVNPVSNESYLLMNLQTTY